MSSIIDYQDRATCIIFGDGAGAVLLEPNYNGLGLQDAILKSDGSGSESLHMKAGVRLDLPVMKLLKLGNIMFIKMGKLFLRQL